MAIKVSLTGVSTGVKIAAVMLLSTPAKLEVTLLAPAVTLPLLAVTLLVVVIAPVEMSMLLAVGGLHPPSVTEAMLPSKAAPIMRIQADRSFLRMAS